ncbi:alpha/beta hydrolase [Streptomyces sp. NPDC056159]|uniref:alpha/beta fold hydrolase n=1 Tax=Streptomyces sp. NPDC056159 TaxID=3155537 RepID=UPI00343C15FE
MNTDNAKRSALTIDGRTLSYVDFGGPGRPLLALHGHMSEGMSYADLAARLAPDWRVIAPDQRGHGDSDRAADYSREGYLADLEALMDHLGLDRAALLGHSLGAINAYQFAARHPERVTALVNGEGCTELGLDGSNPLAFVLNLPGGTCPSREAFVAQLGPFAPFLESAVRKQPDGTWGLHFHPKDIYESENQVHGRSLGRLDRLRLPGAADTRRQRRCAVGRAGSTDGRSAARHPSRRTGDGPLLVRQRPGRLRGRGPGLPCLGIAMAAAFPAPRRWITMRPS